MFANLVHVVVSLLVESMHMYRLSAQAKAHTASSSHVSTLMRRALHG